MENISRVRTTTSIITIQLIGERNKQDMSKPLISLTNKYFISMFTWQMFICIIDVLSLIKTAIHNTNKHFIGHIYE